MPSFIGIASEPPPEIDFPFNGTIERIRLVQMFSPVRLPSNG
jgi:hypothetical protein